MGKRKDRVQHAAKATSGPSRGKRGRPPSDKPSYGEWRAWWATVTTGSFSRAGARLGVRKAMVQKSVQLLQAKLQDLLDRPGLQLYTYDAGARAVRPTPDGEALFRGIHGAVETLEAVDRITAPLRRRSGVCVATSQALWQGEIWDLVGDMKKRFPEADIQSYSHGSRKCLQQLAAGEADIAFVAADELTSTPLGPEITAITYAEYAIELVVRKNTRLADNVTFWQEFDGVTTSLSEVRRDALNNVLHQIVEATLYLPGRFSTFRRSLEKHLFQELELDNVREEISGEQIMSAVEHGLGVTLQQSYVIDSYLSRRPDISKQLIRRELTRLMPRWRIAMVYDENRLGNTAKALVDAARNRRH